METTAKPASRQCSCGVPLFRYEMTTHVTRFDGTLCGVFTWVLLAASDADARASIPRASLCSQAHDTILDPDSAYPLRLYGACPAGHAAFLAEESE